MNKVSQRRHFGVIVLASAAAVTAACSGGAADNRPAASSPTPAASPTVSASPTPVQTVSPTPAASPAGDAKTDGKAVENLIGKWNGPEGTYLEVAKKDGKFAIAIKDLDAVANFEGTAKGNVIEFTRDGKTETIKAATGDETGMKYLAGKKNCVVVTEGSEGFCK